MGPRINAAKAAAAAAFDTQGTLGSVNPNLPPVIPRYQVQLMAICTVIANLVLPILDRITFLFSWIEGFVFGPESTPVRHSGKDTVLITGASTGIGFDAAVTLAKQGIVVFAGVRQQRDLDRLAQLGISTLIPIQLDVTSPQSIRSAVSTVSAALSQRGGVQLVGLVNNAGVPMSGAMDTTTRQDIEHVFNVNVNGALEVTQAFLPLVRQHARGGRIVLIGSIAGVATAPHNGIYSASKRAVEGLFEGLRMELAAEKIHVSIIRPGGIGTPIWTKFPEARDKTRGRAFAELARVVANYGAIPPYHVTRSIHHALTSRFPSHNYVVGLDARAIQMAIQYVPARLYDLVLRSVMLKGE